jgi:prepilin-type N-terminal cleavage/methylation domain-containing protein
VHRARTAGARGFTLIELTVALVAGLLVAMAVATLSHEATATFNEEVRISAAEAALRTAADRLRSDLQHASYMSTPNIEIDPMISRPFGQAAPLLSTATAAARGLQGILLTQGSSALNASNGLALDTKNSVSPSTIDITGNMSNADAFAIDTKVLTGGCCKVILCTTSPAIFRHLNSNAAGVPDPNADLEMQNTFAPAPAPTGSTFTKAQFWVRYNDLITGKSEFILTCKNGGQQIAGVSIAGGAVQPYVLLDACPMEGSKTQNTVTNGNAAGTSTVNPVVTARWEVVAPNSGGTKPPQQDITALDNSPLEGGADNNKYDLVRSLVDGNGNLLPETTEVVAEYAVNLDFAFSVDTSTVGANPAIQAFDFGNALNASVAQSVLPLNATPVAGGTSASTIEPQRIRSVKFMIETRAAIPDRTASIPVATAGDGGGGAFLYRYCMNPAGCSGTTLQQWARVRTLISEVALTNQQQAFY